MMTGRGSLPEGIPVTEEEKKGYYNSIIAGQTVGVTILEVINTIDDTDFVPRNSERVDIDQF
jgi:hypothetical protein